MSRFLGRQAAALTPYTPGEQPRDRAYIKLNTNECPYPPAPDVADALADAAERVRLYPDPEALELRRAFAGVYGVDPSQVFAANGSDEVLAFAFLAFFDRGDKVFFPDPSYGFYPVYADLCGLRACSVPLREDYRITPGDFYGRDGHILIANPNAPTGLALPRGEIAGILERNPDRLVIVDEAYVDFAGDISAVPLLAGYDNLLVVGTLSKSRSLAGMRLGYALGSRELIAALERIKYSFNPYNVNRATQAAGIAALRDGAHFRETTGKVKRTRTRVSRELTGMGLRVLESEANFLFVSHPRLSGGELTAVLRENGILVRCFAHPATLAFARISIGTDEEMDTLLRAVRALG